MGVPAASWYAILALAAVTPSASFACSCPSRNLEQHYEGSENVFTALVTKAELVEVRQVAGRFHVTEVFKGDIPFETVVAYSGGCGMTLQVGAEYLFFVGDSGRIESCSATGFANVGDHRGRSAWVEALRDYQSGRLKHLTSIWHFSEHDKACMLRSDFLATQHRLVSYIDFSYRHAVQARQESAASDLQRGYTEVSISLPTWDEAEGSIITVETARGLYLAIWEKVDRASPGSYKLSSADARELALQLQELDSIRLKGSLARHRSVDAEIPTADARGEIQKFLACMDTR